MPRARSRKSKESQKSQPTPSSSPAPPPMHAGVLSNLLLRLASDPPRALITHHQLMQWPQDQVTALREQSLIKLTSPSHTALCPGCESSCVMPVEISKQSDGSVLRFIVCDARDDIHCVSIPEDDLTLWEITLTAVARFVATQLQIEWNRHPEDERLRINVGLANGKKRKKQLLALQIAGNVQLIVGSTMLPLVEFIQWTPPNYQLDTALVAHAVDISKVSDSHYIPDTERQEQRKEETVNRYKTWRNAHRKLVKSSPGHTISWYARQIASMAIAEGRAIATITRIISGRQNVT